MTSYIKNTVHFEAGKSAGPDGANERKGSKTMVVETVKAKPEETKELRTALGRWLKDVREEQGLSQRDLANILNLEYYTFVSQLEHGRGRIPVHRYADWAQALNQDPREFVKVLLSYYEPSTYEILFA